MKKKSEVVLKPKVEEEIEVIEILDDIKKESTKIVEKESSIEKTTELKEKKYKQYICVLLLFILSIVALIYMYINIK